ncbi:MAG: alpha-galactosidase [Pirellulaceae bacterium]|jgi:alpha-galactosidase|nr:alpha-galactosidase [Pirellulaceae bacterium]
MPKIAMIGAGSIVFSTTLLNDMLATPSLSDSTFMLMGPTEAKLRRVENYIRRLIDRQGLGASVHSTTNRREALAGADYVITVFQVGGMDAFQIDYEIPKKYGIDVCVGQCVGPGGVFRALRSIPVMVDLVRDMEELCPRACLLNYVNPMAMLCMAIGLSSRIRFVGLCHGVQTTLDLISRYAGVPKSEIDFLAAGINHMAWFLKVERNGTDLYPQVLRNLEQPEYYVNEKVRGEVARHFGYFCTESSGHLSDYLPWFRKSAAALQEYCDQPGLGGESGFSYAFGRMMEAKYGQTDYLQYESGELAPRSVEYCSYILEALETSQPFRFNGNVMNNGFIANLPADCCVEVPIYADRLGLHPVQIGRLPGPLAAMNQSNVTVQQLGAQAALAGDPELAVAAIAMDPLTSSVLTLKEIRDMTIEMFDGQQQFLPQFAGRRPRRLHTVRIPEHTVGVDVPLDPALAVVHRFGKLMQNI